MPVAELSGVAIWWVHSTRTRLVAPAAAYMHFRLQGKSVSCCTLLVGGFARILLTVRRNKFS